MTKNLGISDRVLRLVAATGLLVCSGLAPWPLWLRAGVLGVGGAYLLLTALLGTCLGYAMMGRSTCAVRRQS